LGRPRAGENVLGHVEERGFRHARPQHLPAGCQPRLAWPSALAYALDFARKREAFGSPIADLQAISS
jgi:hypothetical protein